MDFKNKMTNKPRYAIGFLLAIILFYSMVSDRPLGLSIKCAVGWESCLKSQGNHIPTRVVVSLLEDCRRFTSHNIGAVVIKMSQEEVFSRVEINGINDPFFRANNALDQLIKSPLVFKRGWENLDYNEMKASCIILNKDFNAWVRQ